MRYQVFRWQIDDTLASANEIIGGLSHLPQPEHGTPAQPPRRRHGRKIRRAIGVQSADKRYGGSEIENGGFDGLMHAIKILTILSTALSVSCGQTRSFRLLFAMLETFARE